MQKTIIHKGDESKKGNMICPKCGEVVNVQSHWGDPPKCGCGAYYRPMPEQSRYIS